MIRTAWASVLALLRKPLFGTTVIPRNATVDPALFPEDDYPVYCNKCGYLLRGLPDGKCPECGTSFERGSLLVKAYAGYGSGARWQHSAAMKWCWRSVVTGCAIPFLAILGASCWLYFVNSGPPNPPSPAAGGLSSHIIKAVGATIYAIPLFTLIAFVIAVKAYPRGSWRRRSAIIAAIKQADQNVEGGRSVSTEEADPAAKSTGPPRAGSSTC